MKKADPPTSLEVIHPVPKGSLRVALFDFDGTLSLIRRGWQKIMVDYMVELLEEVDPEGRFGDLDSLVEEYVAQLTGKQTIYQMIRLSEEIEKRGGSPCDAVSYKYGYHERLWERIEERIRALQNGSADPEEWLVPGSRSFLEALDKRGVRLYLASGTDEQYVVEEARLLKIDHFFEGIHGALDEYKKFSKKLIIDRVYQKEHLKGPDFVSFGDGYVEIENTREVGGIAVGVASNEETLSGCDEWKRKRLIRAGAHVIVPDFEGHRDILELLSA